MIAIKKGGDSQDPGEKAAKGEKGETSPEESRIGPGARLNSGLADFFWQRAKQQPHLILPVAIALLNGYWHRLKFFLLRKRVCIEPGFRVYGKFRIIGPGKIHIGSGCFVLGKILRPVSFVTWNRDSQITIGDNVGFNGTVINCYERVSIEDMCNIADAYIIDSSAHHLAADRRCLSVETVPTKPVRLCRNVWISLQTVIFKGVTIGKILLSAPVPWSARTCRVIPLSRAILPESCAIYRHSIKKITRVPQKNDEIV